MVVLFPAALSLFPLFLGKVLGKLNDFDIINKPSAYSHWHLVPLLLIFAFLFQISLCFRFDFVALFVFIFLCSCNKILSYPVVLFRFYAKLNFRLINANFLFLSFQCSFLGTLFRLGVLC